MEGADDAAQEQAGGVDSSASLEDWHQGDYTLDLREFYLVDIEEGQLGPFGQDVEGLVAISQTCDIVNCGSEDGSIVVAPLVRVNDALLRETMSGRTPSFAPLEHPPAPDVVVDLNRMTTMSARALAACSRRDGFTTDKKRSAFAFALERKHGRFAFPDDFVSAMRPVRKNVLEKHDKATSDLGRVLRSIELFHVTAYPNWEHSNVEISFIIFLKPDNREADLEEIGKQIKDLLAKVKFGPRFTWSDPCFVVGEFEDFTAEQYLGGTVMDFRFLSEKA